MSDAPQSNQNESLKSGRILIVDDDPLVGDSLAKLLERDGYSAETARNGEDALQQVDKAKLPFRLALIDVNMPKMNGVELLERLRKEHPSIVVIMITGYGSIESAVKALRIGAFDYLTKPIVDDEVRTAIERAMNQQVLLAENEKLRDRVSGKPGLGDVVGADHRMQKVYDLIEAVSETRSTVLITGESGTGKSMIAQSIHDHSDFAAGPFVTMACGSVPESLLESELFGHRKGAFTGADRDKQGKLEAANGGTMFIDEINSATPALQLKLLRVLQDKCFEPVGSHETIKVDVRFVLATNQPLEQLVRDGAFREDLYYRINVVNIPLPPLRQRGGDVMLLAEHFLAKHCQTTGKVVTEFSDEVIDLFARYRWPGNVRELENAVERAVVLSRTPRVEAESLPDKVQFQTPDGEPGFRERRKNPQGWSADLWRGEALSEALREPEKQIIYAALRANDWNRQQTAEALGINRTTLYKKIKQYGLEEMAAAE